MSPHRVLLVLLVLLPQVFLAGCGMVPYRDLARSRSQNRDLADKIEEQLAQLENLKTHNRSTSDRLADAEKQLAVYTEESGLDRRQLANYKKQHERLARLGIGSARQSDVLAHLAGNYPNLKYDPVLGVAKLDADILFDSGEATLRGETQRMLEEFAGLLKSDVAGDLRVIVTGHTDDRPIAGRETRQQYPNNWHLSAARALIVADFLDSRGIGGHRLGVIGLGRHQPSMANDNAQGRQGNRRVEVYVVEPDIPLVGWNDSITPLYR